MTELTQGKIAFVVSISSLFIQWFALLGIYYLVQPFPIYIFLVALVNSVLIFAVITVLIEIFILRKVRIIYRIFSSIGKKISKNELQDPELFEKLSIQLTEYRIEKSIEIEKLKENESFRKEFISNVSHELKTPLTSIQGYAELIQDSLHKNKEVQQNYIDKISKNTDRLIDIVEDLTTISQAENKQLKLDMSRYDLYESIAELIDSLENIAKEKKIKIELKNIHFNQYLVYADRAKIEQVLYNLIENSLSYSSEKTKLTLRFSKLDHQVLIEVIDQGNGISTEHLPRIFERFYRIDENRSRAKGGSGLGLSIVKNLLEAHSQTINVESQIGEGTTFYFTLDLV